MTATRPASENLAGYKLVEVPVSAKTVWRFIALYDERNLTGYGEYSFDGAPEDTNARMSAFAASLIGSPATRLSLPTRHSDRATSLADATLLSAVEQALADIEARAAELPLWRYLGGTSNAPDIPLYANINRRTTDRSPKGFAQSAALAVNSGFSRIKIAPFDELTPGSNETGKIDIGLERIRAVRGVIGTRELMVDCHWRFAPGLCHNILRDLSALGVTWLECPISESAENIPEIVALREAANGYDIRMAGLEEAFGWEGFRPYVESAAYDIIMPDIKHCGGFGQFFEIAEQASRFDVAVSAHNPTGPIAHIASLHATATIGTPEPLEVQFGESPLFFELTNPASTLVGGAAPLPAGIGLGVDLVHREDGA